MSSTQYKPGEKGNPENGLVCFGGVCRGKGWCSWRCWRESWNHASPDACSPADSEEMPVVFFKGSAMGKTEATHV